MTAGIKGVVCKIENYRKKELSADTYFKEAYALCISYAGDGDDCCVVISSNHTGNRVFVF